MKFSDFHEKLQNDGKWSKQCMGVHFGLKFSVLVHILAMFSMTIAAISTRTLTSTVRRTLGVENVIFFENFRWSQKVAK